MKIQSPFSRVLSNPFVDTLLLAKAAESFAPLFKGDPEKQQRDIVAQSVAQGEPVTQIPRTGLIGAFGRLTGHPMMQPVDATTQAYSKIALQQEKDKALPEVIDVYKSLGPEALKSKSFSGLLSRAGLSADMFSDGGHLTPTLSIAKSLGMDVTELSKLSPDEQEKAVRLYEGSPAGKAAAGAAEQQSKLDVLNQSGNRQAAADRAGEQQRARAQNQKPQVVFRYEMDPTGATIQVPYKVNPDGTLTRAVIAGGGSGGGVTTPSGNILAKLDANQQKQLDSVRNVRAQIPRIEAIIADLPPDLSAATLAKEYAKYRAPFGALGTVDPRLADYFQQLGQTKTDLTAAAMGGSRGKYLFDYLKPHIPSETDPPARAMEKLRGFDEGRFNALMHNYLGGAAEPGPLTTSPPPPAPGFPVSRSFTKGSDWYVQSSDGRYYQFDKASNQWRPL